MAKTDPGKGLAFTIRDEDLEDLQKLHTQLHEAADQHRQDGRIFMAQTYVMLIAIVDPLITRIEMRFKREALASTRREVKELKLDARLQKQNGSSS
jgi:hypothetical protein